MKAYCSLPFDRMKIDSDGSYQSCCHQTTYYGNILTDNTTIEEAFKGKTLVSVKNSVMSSKMHPGCNNTKCPLYFTLLERDFDVTLSKYPKQIELALPSSWCNIGGLNPTPDTACIMCPRSSERYISNFVNIPDNTDLLLDIIKPAIPHLETFTLLGIAEPFYKGRLFDVLDRIEFKKYKDSILFWTFCNGSLFGEKYQDMFVDEYTSKSCIGFSIDAATPETYIKIRRLDYYAIIQKNLERYFNKVNNLGYKRDWSFTAYNINMLNLHEMEDMLRFGNNIGANKVQYTLTYISDPGMKIDKNLLCNAKNWNLFWEKQQRIEQLAAELNQEVEFYLPFHGGYINK
jgi:hypothetical protein